MGEKGSGVCMETTASALGDQSSWTPRGMEGTGFQVPENLQSQKLSGREVPENYAGWRLHPSGLHGKPELRSAAGFGGSSPAPTCSLGSQGCWEDDEALRLWVLRDRPWVGTGTRPKIQLYLNLLNI